MERFAKSLKLVNEFKCPKCGKVVGRDSSARKVKSYCEKTGKNVWLESVRHLEFFEQCCSEINKNPFYKKKGYPKGWSKNTFFKLYDEGISIKQAVGLYKLAL